ncbi:MAG TPA: hypothetical protein GXZ85_05730 [Firmicutes bacterium]|jgi:hypothetical protein|nr:hypothetical protein [Bacillota bacterium]
MSNSDVPVKEIGELLDMMSNKLPGLIKELYEILYSEEGAVTMSKALATFYKNLLDAGMDKNEAMSLTREYLSTLKSLTSQYGNS